MNSPIYSYSKSIPSKSYEPRSLSYNQANSNNKDILFKKFLRGRLTKLINESIITEEDPFISINSDRDQKEDYSNKNKYQGIVVKSFPNIIGSELKITNRMNDYYVTPKEIIYNNFTKKEIDLIRSDPTYFKLNMIKPFNKLDIIKTKTLLEKLNEEENPIIEDKKELYKKIQSKIKLKKNIIKSQKLDKSSNYEKLPTIHLKQNGLLNIKERSLNNSREKNKLYNHTLNNSPVSINSNYNDHAKKLNKYSLKKNIAKEKISHSISISINKQSSKIIRNIKDKEDKNKEQILINELKMKIKKCYLK